jgi:PAS domain S-box-containing protein
LQEQAGCDKPEKHSAFAHCVHRYFGRLYIFEDISDSLRDSFASRKRVEEALRLSDFSFERSSIPAVWIKRDASIWRVNEAACHTLGYSRDQLQSMHVYDIDPDFSGEVWSEHWQALKQQKTITFISRHRTKDGRIIPVELTLNYLEFNGEEYNFAFSRDISFRQQAEAELRQARNFLETTIDHLPVAVCVKDGKEDTFGTFRLWNKTSERMFGLTSQQVIGKTDYDFFSKQQADFFYQKDREAFERGTLEDIPEEIIDSYNLGLRILHTVKVPIYDKNHEPQYLLCISEDITERKQALEALRQSEARFRAALEGSLDAFFVLQSLRDETGRIEDFTFIDLNSNGEKLISMPKEKVIGKRLCELLQLDRTGGFFEKYVRVVETGEVLEEEFPICVPGINASWLQHQVIPLADGIAIASRDITQRKQAEKALRSSEEQYRRIVETTTEGIWVLDAQNNTTFVNPQLAQMLGYSLDEIVGQSFFAFMDEHKRAIAELYLKRRYNGIREQHDFKFRRKDGSNLWAIVSARPIFDQAGNYVGTLKMLTDITRRKQAEEALQQQFQRERLVGATLRRIHQSLNLEEILNTTVAEVRQFLECDRVLIFRFHEDGSGVVIVESVGSDWKPMSGTVINDRYLAQIYIKLYQQGRVQAVEDIYAADLTQCHVELLEKFQARANLVVPIVQEEKLWGLLVAQQCGETRQWQSLEIDLLKSLSTQAAIAIHQSELYQHSQAEIIQRQQTEAALQQQFQRERLIGAISQRIRQSLKLEDILNTTVAEVRQVLASDRVVIFRFEPDWSGKVVVESVDDRCLPILGKNIYDPCFKEAYVFPYQEGRVRAIDDIHTANLDQCHINLLAELQVRANLVVPLLKREQLWGLLIAHQCSQPRHWQQFEIDLFCSLASQVAIAIQQSQLYEEAQSLGLREQAINQLTQAIRSSLDLNTIFSTAVCEIGSLLQVDRAQIVQYLPERKLWLNVSEYRKSKDLPATLGVEVPDENNRIASRLKRLEIVRIDDADTCEDEIHKAYAPDCPGAWLLVPLHFGSKLWGSLGLVRKTRPYQWQESEVELICAVADQVAIAIQQAKLYEQSCTATATAITQARQLEQALSTLQRTQTHLVQSEKMSSLGQLVAGVAHEINNPVNFIYANLDHASEYIEDLIGLVELYQQQYPNPSPDIQSEIETIELDFLIEDLPKLLDSMKVGAERICEIVRSLRNFSRLSEAEIKPVDIHEGLDSTLMILQSRLKAQGKHPEIQVIKEYGNLPKVECYAGQLNQVFMNVLSNAIDAIDEQNQMRSFEEIKANPSKITVRTELFNEHQVAIRIADNGPGMTEQVKQRLFDPFFTTKPVGSGTGLGLSISYQIVVEKHSGQIHCFSELGQGTEFVIQIPLRHRAKEPQALLEELK